MNENVVPMTESEFGIKETSEAVIGAGEFVSKLDEALSDGKFDFINDSLLIAPTLPKLIEAIKGGKKIPMEIDDLDADEYNALLQLIEEKFELSREYAERVAEAAFRWLIATVDLGFAIKGQ